MSKPFDATLKQLLDQFAADWLAALAPRLGLPPTVAADPLDVDLATVQMSADKVFRLRPPAEGLVHVEPQANWDGDFADRLLEYNALLHRRYGGPVYTVAVLLRPEANSPAVSGVLIRRFADGREYLRFVYDVLRVWEQPAEPLLTGGLGLTPLALLTDEVRDRDLLGASVDRIDARARAEGMPDADRVQLMLCGYLLSGLRYTDPEIAAAFVRVRGMKESASYQAILREGRQAGREEGRIEGRLNEKRVDVLAVLAERFGAVPEDVEARVLATDDLDRLSAALLQAVRVTDPNDIQM